jgi:hypothetical protein
LSGYLIAMVGGAILGTQISLALGVTLLSVSVGIAIWLVLSLLVVLIVGRGSRAR